MKEIKVFFFSKDDFSVSQFVSHFIESKVPDGSIRRRCILIKPITNNSLLLQNNYFCCSRYHIPTSNLANCNVPQT